MVTELFPSAALNLKWDCMELGDVKRYVGLNRKERKRGAHCVHKHTIRERERERDVNTPKASADLIKTVSLAPTVRRENISLSKL